jgi:uncharacterized protein (TIGR03382 family)
LSSTSTAPSASTVAVTQTVTVATTVTVEGEGGDDGGDKGIIPGPSPVVVLGLLAAVAILARRRLK